MRPQVNAPLGECERMNIDLELSKAERLNVKAIGCSRKLVSTKGGLSYLAHCSLCGKFTNSENNTCKHSQSEIKKWIWKMFNPPWMIAYNKAKAKGEYE
jgi:hypothetical protein